MKKSVLGVFILLVFAMPVYGQFQTSGYALEMTLLNQDPDPVDSGDIVELRFKIENNARDVAKDVTVEFVPRYPFSLVPGEEAVRGVGDVHTTQSADTRQDVRYRIRVASDAPEDEYEVTLRYGPRSGAKTSEDFLIDVDDQDVTFAIGSVLTEPEELVEDTDDAKLSVELQNVGDGDAENVVVDFSLPSGFSPSYGYSTRQSLGTIEGGGSETADFYVDVDEGLAGGIYDGMLIINYVEGDDDSNRVLRKEMHLKIPLHDTPLFEITDVSVSPTPLEAEDDGQVRLTIRNSGNEKAESVSIRAFKESTQPFEFEEKSDFVGKLDPGQPGEAVLTFSVEKGAIAKEYLLDLEIRAVDGQDVRVYSKTVPITVSEKAGSGMNPVVLVVLVVVLAGAGWFVWRKARK